MLNDDRTPYRWQDHVIAPRRTAFDLIATALIVAVVAAATAGAFGSRGPETDPTVAMATERTPSLAHLVKRPASTHRKPETLKGC